jgi:hypothetical protein
LPVEDNPQVKTVAGASVCKYRSGEGVGGCLGALKGDYEDAVDADNSDNNDQCFNKSSKGSLGGKTKVN